MLAKGAKQAVNITEATMALEVITGARAHS